MVGTVAAMSMRREKRSRDRSSVLAAQGWRQIIFLLVLGTGLAGCQPTVRLEAPKEPITINLNIKADVRLRIEEQAEKDIERNKEIF